MKMRGSEKKNEQEHVRHFLHKTSNQEVSGSFTARCSRRANQRQRNVQKKSVLHVLHRLAIRNYIFCLSKL